MERKRSDEGERQVFQLKVDSEPVRYSKYALYLNHKFSIHEICKKGSRNLSAYILKA